MQSPKDPRAQGTTVDPTEARQASPRKMNFRVLLASMALAVAVGVVLVAGFWRTTPTAMDYSSGGNKLSEPTAPAAQPAAPTETAPASPAAPPGQQTPSNP